MGSELYCLLVTWFVNLESAFPNTRKVTLKSLELIYQVSLLNCSNLFVAYLLSVCRFSTGFGVSGGSTLIHEFYSREVQNPIHLTVDTGFTRGEASIKAYISSNLSLGDRHLAAQFQEIPLDLRMIEAEKAGCMCHFPDC
jgi:hypothetical protein